MGIVGGIGRALLGGVLACASLSPSYHHDRRNLPILYSENPYRCPEDVWNMLPQETRNILWTIQPEDVQFLNKILTETGSEELAGIQNEINGTSREGRFKIPVNHRDALITGRAYGMDTYKCIEKQLILKVCHGVITDEEAKPMLDVIERLKAQTPKQRKAVFDLLDQMAWRNAYAKQS